MAPEMDLNAPDDEQQPEAAASAAYSRGVQNVEVALAPTSDDEDEDDDVDVVDKDNTNNKDRELDVVEKGNNKSSIKKKSQQQQDKNPNPPLKKEQQQHLSSPPPLRHDREEIRFYRLTLASNIWFMIASVFYLWLAVITLNYYKQLEGVPAWVLQADDDYSWYGYMEDDYVFETTGGAWVSRYTIVYSVAALGFVFTGCLDFIKQPGVLGIVFILAGGFGLASAMTVDVNPNLSVIFNAVSVHLFMLEAIGLLFRRSFFGGLEVWLRISDSCFLAGSLMDVAISWTAIFNYYNTTLARLGVLASCLWIVTASIYVVTTCAIQRHGKGFEDAMYPHPRDHQQQEQQTEVEKTSADPDDTPSEEEGKLDHRREEEQQVGPTNEGPSEEGPKQASSMTMTPTESHDGCGDADDFWTDPPCPLPCDAPKP